MGTRREIHQYQAQWFLKHSLLVKLIGGADPNSLAAAAVHNAAVGASSRPKS